MDTTDDQVAVAHETMTQRLDRTVTAHRSAPGRAVFTEHGNTDGWISTNHTVEIER